MVLIAISISLSKIKMAATNSSLPSEISTKKEDEFNEFYTEVRKYHYNKKINKILIFQLVEKFKIFYLLYNHEMSCSIPGLSENVILIYIVFIAQIFVEDCKYNYKVNFSMFNIT